MTAPLENSRLHILCICTHLRTTPWPYPEKGTGPPPPFPSPTLTLPVEEKKSGKHQGARVPECLLKALGSSKREIESHKRHAGVFGAQHGMNDSVP